MTTTLELATQWALLRCTRYTHARLVIGLYGIYCIVDPFDAESMWPLSAITLISRKLHYTNANIEQLRSPQGWFCSSDFEQMFGEDRRVEVTFMNNAATCSAQISRHIKAIQLLCNPITG